MIQYYNNPVEYSQERRWTSRGKQTWVADNVTVHDKARGIFKKLFTASQI